MRLPIRLPIFCLSLAMALGQQRPVLGQPAVILQKGIKAHGGAANLNRLKAGHTKTEGKIELGDGIPFSQEAIYQLPKQLKEVQELYINGQKRTVIVVLDGARGWISNNGQTAPLTDELLRELTEAAYLLRVTRLAPLADRSFELSDLGDAEVNGRPATGVRVSSRGHRDLSLYFDVESSLLVKVQRRTRDAATMKEVTEERVYSDFREIDGIQTPQKTIVYRDGKRFMVGTVRQVNFLEKVSEDTFSKP